MELEEVICIPDDEGVSSSTTHSLASVDSNTRKQNVDPLEIITVDDLDSVPNSCGFAYNKLVPITVQGLQNLSKLSGFNSSSRLLLIENETGNVFGNLKLNIEGKFGEDRSVVKKSNINKVEDADCIIIDDSDTEVEKESSALEIPNPFNAVRPVEKRNENLKRESQTQNQNFAVSEFKQSCLIVIVPKREEVIVPSRKSNLCTEVHLPEGQNVAFSQNSSKQMPNVNQNSDFIHNKKLTSNNVETITPIVITTNPFNDIQSSKQANIDFTKTVQKEFPYINQDCTNTNEMDDPLAVEAESYDGYKENADMDVEPFFITDFNSEEPDECSNSSIDEVIETKTEILDSNIKCEVFDEEPCCSYTVNKRVTMKSEEAACELVEGSETVEMDGCSNDESTDGFLYKNPEIFTKFCGLPSIATFNALLNYVEDDMKVLKGATKFEQLFSVLAKLHRNEDNLYLNKYIFPPAYVYTVELLYDKLKLWCNSSPDFSVVPEILTPEFALTQNIVIVGILTVAIRSNNRDFSEKVKSVKYVIAYTAFGEAFFVSNAFVGTTATLKLITYCGILDKLEKDHWILFHQESMICATQVKKLLLKPKRRTVKKSNISESLCTINSERAQQHTSHVVNRLTKNFKVLESVIPDFMLRSESDLCFLDRLVFVCCMLQNMLPRVTYK